MPVTGRARRSSSRGAALLVASAALGCGARTGLNEALASADAGRRADALADTASEPLPACVADKDCEGFDDKCSPVVCDPERGRCTPLAAVVCDDKDPCTGDSCDPATGKCSHRVLAVDLDRDGHPGPLPGHTPGDPGSCGDDCDDTSPLAHPGQKETCDGVDNDCNGVVDDNAAYVPVGADAVRIDGEGAPAAPGGLAWSGSGATGYLATYTGTVSAKTRVFAQRLSVDGQKLGGPGQVTLVNADAAGGAVAWTGDRYGVVWADRRDGDYELFFNRLGPDGAKLGPDVQLSNAYGFSVYGSVVFNGLYFVVVWEDDRSGPFEVYGQRVDLDGKLVGGNVRLTTSTTYESEAPVLAVSQHGVGVAWHYGSGSVHRIMFRHFSPELEPLSKEVRLTAASATGRYPIIVWNKQSYVVAWFDIDHSPQAVYGAVVNEDGTVVVPATVLTNSPRHSRYPSLLPLGDRMLLVYSDDRDQNLGYELYSRMLTSKLAPWMPEARLTFAQGESVYPTPAFGPSGDIGVLFRDDRLSAPHVYFTRLRCQAGSTH
jgi:hypothetical protein